MKQLTLPITTLDQLARLAVVLREVSDILEQISNPQARQGERRGEYVEFKDVEEAIHYLHSGDEPV